MSDNNQNPIKPPSYLEWELPEGEFPSTDQSPIIPGRPSQPAPLPTVPVYGTHTVSLIPPGMQQRPELLDTGVPTTPLMPIAPAGQAAVNAAVKSQITVEQSAGNSGPLLETNGNKNATQNLLNLQAGSNIFLSDDGLGNITIVGGSESLLLLPEGTATAAANFNSNPLTFEASYWNGSAPAIDSWSIQLFPGSDPLSSGTDLEINHSTLNGAGRFHVNSDMLIGPPLSATPTQNSNSFAWDVEGSYWDGTQTQYAIWEQALGVVPASGDSGLNARLSMYPLFTGASGTGDIAIGGTGVNPLQGYPVTTPYWILKAYPVIDGNTLTLEHTGLTANRTINFPDASDTLAVPSVAQTWSAPQTFSEIISASSNPAQSEFIRLADGDGIAWRNAANNSDLYITTDGSDNLILHNFGGLNMNGKYIETISYLQSNTSNAAQSGVLRLANTDTIAWRNAANSADLPLTVDSSNNLNWNSGVLTIDTSGDIKLGGYMQIDAVNSGPILSPDTGRYDDQGLRVQTGVTNENSALTVMPNGTSNESTFRLYNASDSANTGLFGIDLTGTTVTFQSDNFGTGSAPTLLNCQLPFNAQSGYQANGTPGVSAGAFSSITSIQSTNGLVTTLTGTSDERLKTDIKPFERGLDAILQLNPSLYKWNAAGQQKTGFSANDEFAGFIAQDVQKAIPEAVSTEGEYLALSDRPIIAALVNAVKELAAENRALKLRLDALEKQD